LNPEEHEEARAIALREANSIRTQAQADAAQIIRGAQTEAGQLLEAERMRVHSIIHSEAEEAKRLGYEEGYLQSQHAVEQEYAARLEAVEQLYLTAVEERKRYLADAEPMIVDLACAIARKIMQRETHIQPDWILNVVRAALEEVNDAGKIEVRVHPEDFDLIQANREGLRKEVPGQTELLVIPDRGVEAGGCVLHTSFGNIDARIDTQLEEVKKALQEVVVSLDHDPTNR
jgi:flagellar assembly protein FliH